MLYYYKTNLKQGRSYQKGVGSNTFAAVCGTLYYYGLLWISEFVSEKSLLLN